MFAINLIYQIRFFSDINTFLRLILPFIIYKLSGSPLPHLFCLILISISSSNSRAHPSWTGCWPFKIRVIKFISYVMVVSSDEMWYSSYWRGPLGAWGYPKMRLRKSENWGLRPWGWVFSTFLYYWTDLDIIRIKLVLFFNLTLHILIWDCKFVPEFYFTVTAF